MNPGLNHWMLNSGFSALNFVCPSTSSAVRLFRSNENGLFNQLDNEIDSTVPTHWGRLGANAHAHGVAYRNRQVLLSLEEQKGMLEFLPNQGQIRCCHQLQQYL